MDEIATLMEPLAQHFLGEPNHQLSKKGELRYGTRGSLSIDIDKGTWFDFEADEGGGVLDFVTRETGITDPKERGRWLREFAKGGVQPARGNGRFSAGVGPKAGKIVAVYPYEDERGRVLFEVVRFEPKGFRQRGPDGTWGLKGVRRRQVPYRLPELLEHVGHPIFIVEGEKDVEALLELGVPATCNVGGAGKWSPAYNKHFKKADVIIIADNDPQSTHPRTGEPMFHDDGRPVRPGQDHAHNVAQNLRGIAERIRLLDLAEHWPECPPKGDICDWLAAGGTAAELWRIAEKLPRYRRPKPQQAEQPTGGNGQAASGPDTGPAPHPPRTLVRVHEVFKKWLGGEFDMMTLDAVLAVTAAAKLGGDAAWLLVISGSGNAKTETVSSIAEIPDTHLISTIASQGALLSATSKKSQAKGATGGLLRKIGDRGILVIKDFTSILSIDHRTRLPILSALREIHDGRWDRSVGSDGGLTLTWTGHIVCIGACTTAWDQAHSVIAQMGDRFVLIRSDSRSGRDEASERAINNTGAEAAMRQEMTDTIAGLIESMVRPHPRDLILQDDEKRRIRRAANIVTLARTGVETDYRGDVVDSHAPEMPTRFAKQLAQIVRGGIAIGTTRQAALDLAIRCARDSIPQLRLAVLLDLKDNGESSAWDIHRRLQKPFRTIERVLQALHVLDLATCRYEDDRHSKKKADKPLQFYELTADTDAALDALK